MSDPVEAYLGWLALQVRQDNGRSYDQLLAIMLQKEFVWSVPNDDNRIEDALDVRREFTQETGIRVEGACGVLEVLIALSRHLEFMAEGDAAGWAWQLLCNLELHKLSDPIGPRKAIRADEILENLIWRTYSPDGVGGFFPLSWPDEDQRKVEIWYQMAFYVDEIHPEY